MLHARNDFLADVAALVEIDAAELIHVGFVGKRVAVGEVAAAARHAKRDAVGLVFRGVDQRRAEISGGLGEMRRDDAQAERRQARVGEAKAVVGGAGSPLPSQTASTPSVPERSSTMTLARSL